MDKIIRTKKLSHKNLLAIEPHLQKMTSESSQKVAIWLTKGPYDGIEADSMIRFIKAYIRSAHPVFTVEMYKYLQTKDNTLLEEYVKRFVHMKTHDEGLIKKTRRVEKNRIVDKTDRRIKRKAVERAKKSVQLQREERSETKEKMRQFYSDVQKYK